MCWIRANEQCTRLWQGRWKDIGSIVKRGPYHEKWDEWIWTRVARDKKMNMEDEKWYDKVTLVEWKGHKELLTTYKKRAIVQREVGRRWQEEHTVSAEQKKWIREECGTEQHWERTEASWSRSLVRWGTRGTSTGRHPAAHPAPPPGQPGFAPRFPGLAR